uniref:hypothetical protein n=1 Tax=Thaumasiovibrio occultus TaxID=1891184 RepID=UPI00192D0875
MSDLKSVIQSAYNDKISQLYNDLYAKVMIAQGDEQKEQAAQAQFYAAVAIAQKAQSLAIATFNAEYTNQVNEQPIASTAIESNDAQVAPTQNDAQAAAQDTLKADLVVSDEATEQSADSAKTAPESPAKEPTEAKDNNDPVVAAQGEAEAKQIAEISESQTTVEATAEKPQAAAEKPQAAAEKPQAAAETPQAAAEKPQAAAEKPQA